MAIEASFFNEEIRSGFLVTEKRKKVWAAELQMLEKLDEVCQKHHLSYYGFYGTLLGAVRHQGFIPWDDDIDVVMFRDDYEKFQIIAPEEFTEPYFFQNTYTDQVLWPLSKIRDSRTTAVEPQFHHLGASFHQGIFIDIFPLDSVGDNADPTPSSSAIAQIRNLLWTAITNPEAVLAALENGTPLTLSTEFLIDYLKKDSKQKFKIFEALNLSYFDQMPNVNYILYELFPENFPYQSVKKKYFQNIVYLPFEHLQIPVPAGYDKILTQCYGNYHEFVPGGTAHENIVFEPDIPYMEYFA